MLDTCVLPTQRDVYAGFLLNLHYAKRLPPVQFAFGMFLPSGECVGVVTYGPPASPQVRRSAVAEGEVLELNRLVVTTTEKNAASFLVGSSLRLLPASTVVVSYADGKMGHIGYIYQACNFFYAGEAVAHDAEYIVNGVAVHPGSLTARGVSAPKKWAAENGITVVPPKPKHRYWIVTGSRRDKRDAEQRVKWNKLPYPKGRTQRYSAIDWG